MGDHPAAGHKMLCSARSQQTPFHLSASICRPASLWFAEHKLSLRDFRGFPTLPLVRGRGHVDTDEGVDADALAFALGYDSLERRSLMRFEPPGQSRSVRVVRLAAGQTRQVVTLGNEFLRMDVHFVPRPVGRSTLCTGADNCPLCLMLPARPHWYLPCRCAEDGAPGVLELACSSARDLEQVVKFATGSFSVGALLEVRRRGKRGGLRFEFLRVETVMKPVAAGEWIPPLMRIFGLPPMGAHEDPEDYQVRVLPNVHGRAGLLAAQYDARPQRSTRGVGAR